MTTFWNARNFLVQVSLLRDRVPSFEAYPFSIPAIAGLTDLTFDRPVTFFVGENGAGKSTLLESIAVASGINPEGGTRNFNFSTRASHSGLNDCLRLPTLPSSCWRTGRRDKSRMTTRSTIRLRETS